MVSCCPFNPNLQPVRIEKNTAKSHFNEDAKFLSKNFKIE